MREYCWLDSDSRAARVINPAIKPTDGDRFLLPGTISFSFLFNWPISWEISQEIGRGE